MSQSGSRPQALAIVTGTSRGLGQEATRQFLAAGWRVLGLARHAPALPAATTYTHVACDLADVAAWESTVAPAVTAALANAPGPVVLVNNAGTVEPIAGVSRLPAQAWDGSLRVNAAAPVWLMGHVLAHARGGELRVINVLSGAATKPYAGWAAYCAGKAALRMAGEVMAAEESDRRARGEAGPRTVIFHYNPGPLDTAMQSAVRGAQDPAFSQRERFARLAADQALGQAAVAAADIVAMAMGEVPDNVVLRETSYGKRGL